MGLLTNILFAFLKPKVERDIAKMKNDPKYIELERRAIEVKKELEETNKKLENARAEQAKIIKSMQKAGIKITANQSPMEQFKAYKDWQAKERASVGLPKLNTDWEKDK
jgi:phosphomevalonate kinase